MFDKALELDPNYMHGIIKIALINIHKCQQALKCFNKVLEINPDFEPAS